LASAGCQRQEAAKPNSTCRTAEAPKQLMWLSGGGVGKRHSAGSDRTALAWSPCDLDSAARMGHVQVARSGRFKTEHLNLDSNFYSGFFCSNSVQCMDLGSVPSL
jgi:hypothetical protein